MSPTPAWGSPTATLARRVRELREARGLSQYTLAAQLHELGIDFAREQIGNLEAGRRQSVTVEQTVALAYALNVSPSDLLTPADVAESMRIGNRDDIPAWRIRKWLQGEGPLLRPGDMLQEAERDFHAVKPEHEYALWQASRSGAPRAARRLADMLARYAADQQVLNEDIDAELTVDQLRKAYQAVRRHVETVLADLDELAEQQRQRREAR
jgi:transcriptional regulator with XRE-family HTH domain